LELHTATELTAAHSHCSSNCKLYYLASPKHPFWYYNIVANPLVELQDGAVKREMRAREAFGKEKDEWWKRADTAYSEFPTYRARAGREIPVLVLEPLQDNDAASP
jgi:deazaflavin-dependent oxidoreductase (nitroreductase family)